MALLNEVGERQTVVAKAHSERDDKAHMRAREEMHGLFVGLMLPPPGQRIFLLAIEIRDGHRRGEEILGYFCQLCHFAAAGLCGTSYQSLPGPSFCSVVGVVPCSA